MFRFLLTLGAMVMATQVMLAMEPLKIVGRTTVGPHELLRLAVTGQPADATIVWLATPDDGLDQADTPKDRFQAAAKPGAYQVVALAISTADGKAMVRTAKVAVTVAGCGPITPPAAPGEKPSAGKLDPVKSIHRIQFGTAGCSAVPVYPQRADGRWDIATAAHCVGEVGQRGVLFRADGTRVAVTVTAVDRGADCAWLVTDEPTDDMFYAKMAERQPTTKTDVWHGGFGVDKPGSIEYGQFVSGPEPDGKNRYRLSVSSGDSGGPIFRASDNTLLGVVCCTTERGKVADVWAAGIKKMRDLRPATKTGDTGGWAPVDIPLRIAPASRDDVTEWTPMEVPLARNK